MPGPLYCDTSALLKLYLPEPDSDAFNEVVEDRNDVLVSDLAVTEMISAIARRLRHGSLGRMRGHREESVVHVRLLGAPSVAQGCRVMASRRVPAEERLTSMCYM